MCYSRINCRHNDVTIDSNGAATSITSNFLGGRNNAVGDTITVLDASN